MSRSPAPMLRKKQSSFRLTVKKTVIKNNFYPVQKAKQGSATEIRNHETTQSYLV